MRRKKSILLVCAVLLLAWLVYAGSWLDDQDEALEHVMRRYTVEDLAIVDGEYLNAGADAEGGYIHFSVTLADGSTCHIRTDVKWRKTFSRIGPQCRVEGIRVENNN